jgi:hypothetical protein
VSLVSLILAGFLGAPPALPPVSVGEASGPFQGGPLDGLQIGDAVTPDGRRFRGLIPSRPNASPVPKAMRPAVEAFVAGHGDASGAPLRPYLRPGAVSIECPVQNRPCRRSRFASLTFGETTRANTPYYMKDRSVRVEWLYGDALFYISTLKLKGGRIASVETAPAWLPLELPARGQE